MLSAHGATPAQVLSAEREISRRACAAQAYPQVVRVLAHCTKGDEVCLVVLPHEVSLVTLVQGELICI